MTTPAAKRPLAAAFDLRANLKALLHRPARQDDHFAPVDGLRAMSVLWVIIFHVTSELGRGTRDSLLIRFLRRGFLGVDVFFVISGFLIGSLVLRERRDCGQVAVGRFYFRRALRVLPAYWVTLAVYCAMLGVNRENFAWNLAFVNNFLPASQQCMPWAWSLAVEEQFYLLFPAFVWLLNRVPQHRRLSFLFGMLALAFAVRGTFIYLDDLYVPGPMRDRRWLETFYARTHVRYGGLLCGVISAYLLLHTDVLSRLRRSRWRVPLLVASVAVVVDLALRRQVFEYGWPNWFNFAYLTTATYLFAMAVACLMLASIAGIPEVRWISRLLQARWLFPIGQLSYASYLVHLLIIQSLAESGTLRRANSLPNLAWNSLVVIVATFGVATAMYLVLERPLMNLRDLRRPLSPPENRENAAIAVGEAA